MRAFVLAAACAAAFCGTSASADTIVQSVSGTNVGGTPLNLFDPSLGNLTSVQIEGSLSWSEALVRSGILGTPAINTPRTATGDLIVQISGVPLASATLSGNETYAEGSIFGSLSLSGALFALLTGANVNPFLYTGGQSSILLAPIASVAPQVGSIQFGPGSPGGSYSLRVTYNFTGVPEPATWAMMLMGFAAIGFAMRRRAQASASPVIS